jgi:hypothetical protein
MLSFEVLDKKNHRKGAKTFFACDAKGCFLDACDLFAVELACWSVGHGVSFYLSFFLSFLELVSASPSPFSTRVSSCHRLRVSYCLGLLDKAYFRLKVERPRPDFGRNWHAYREVKSTPMKNKMTF